MQGSEGLLDYNYETEVKNEESLHEDDFNSLPLAELRSFLFNFLIKIACNIELSKMGHQCRYFLICID